MTQITRAQFFLGTAAAVTAALILTLSPAALAQGVVSEWKTVQAPPAPTLETVTVDPQKTALLIMDFNQGLCGGGARSLPRCVSALPRVKDLLDKARAHHMLIVFTGYPHMAPRVKELAPMKDEQVVVGHADKFDGTDLDRILKDHGITTVITTGVVANGAVLFTAFGAASRGYKVIVPVDAMPGMNAYAEQSSIWGIEHDPGLGERSCTLTSVDMIKFP